MSSNARFAEIAALAGDPARAAMLQALMDGRALTASELARTAGITAQTASSHLARLTASGLLTAAKQGRHRYHRLASPAAARMIESIMQVAAGLQPVKRLSVGPRDAALRAARTCYDHLAGQLGVALTDAMVGRGHVELDADAGLITEPGLAFFARIGLGPDAIVGSGGKRKLPICRGTAVHPDGGTDVSPPGRRRLVARIWDRIVWFADRWACAQCRRRRSRT
jgi:DNA-binding transcriptional ArsR family regulator